MKIIFSDGQMNTRFGLGDLLRGKENHVMLVCEVQLYYGHILYFLGSPMLDTRHIHTRHVHPSYDCIDERKFEEEMECYESPKQYKVLATHISYSGLSNKAISFWLSRNSDNIHVSTLGSRGGWVEELSWIRDYEDSAS